MISSVSQAFQIFDEKIALGDDERRMAFSRARSVSEKIAQDRSVRGCMIVGSLIRSTAISKFSDIDIVAVLDESKLVDLTADSAIRHVNSIIKDFYSDIMLSGNTICISFNEGLRVDVLPALAERDQESVDQKFLIPTEKRTQWQRYRPRAQDRLIAATSARLGPNFKRLIRVVKWWNQKDGRPVSSHEIEIVACKSFEAKMPSLPQAMGRFFDVAIHYFQQTAKRPVPELEEVRALVEQALEFSGRGDPAKACVVWRGLLGEQFPAVIS